MITSPLQGDSMGHRRIPLTKARDAELWCLFLSAPEKMVMQTIESPAIWDAIAFIMTPLQCYSGTKWPPLTWANGYHLLKRSYRNIIKTSQQLNQLNQRYSLHRSPHSATQFYQPECGIYAFFCDHADLLYQSRVFYSCWQRYSSFNGVSDLLIMYVLLLQKTL